MSPLFALMIVPLIGVLGLAAETSGWFYTQRGMQNAADSAARAAATAAYAGGNYANEGAATATKYGYTQGTANATVATTNVACPGGAPAGATTCYQVAITKTLPIYLTKVVGFQGSGALGAGRGQIVRATAIASQQVNYAYCSIALDSGGVGFEVKGGPNFDLGGCDVFSNADANCNGGNSPWGIGTAVAVASAHNNKLCGVTQVFGATPLADPYASLSTAANIPRTGCQSTGTGVRPPSGPITLGASACWNGSTWAPTGTVTITTPSTGSVLYLDNIGINLPSSAAKIVTAAGSSLTIVFTGTAGNNTPGFITGSGTLDFGAPTSGTWSGIVLYQDKRMTKGSTVTYAGNSPTFNLTGLVYAPYADLEFKGAINHQTNGLNCLGVIAASLHVNGTGSIFANSTSQCRQAGLILPTGQTVQYRVALVQ